MTLFKCEWPNGDLSFVLAPNRDEALKILESEVGPAETSWLSVPEEFSVHFQGAVNPPLLH